MQNDRVHLMLLKEKTEAEIKNTKPTQRRFFLYANSKLKSKNNSPRITLIFTNSTYVIKELESYLQLYN